MTTPKPEPRKCKACGQDAPLGSPHGCTPRQWAWRQNALLETILAELRLIRENLTGLRAEVKR